MIISKTPLRISFVGGGTDLPSFYKNNDYGATVSTSINSYIYVIVKEHTTIYDERIRLNYSETELVNDIEDIKHPIIRECLKLLEIDDRIFIGTTADAPPSAGLGSSSTFTVGLLNALYKFKGIVASKGFLAEQASYIEIDILKQPIGKQDQYAASYGGLNHYQFNADNSVVITPLPIKLKELHNLFDNLISFWTRVTRPADSILNEQDENNRTRKINQEILLKMRSQSETLRDYINENGFNVKYLGEMINNGWIMKKQLASKVSNSMIDEYYSIAMENGAIGGKISGAGGGGFLNVIAYNTKHNKLKYELTKKGLIFYNFGFDPNGTIVMEY